MKRSVQGPLRGARVHVMAGVLAVLSASACGVVLAAQPTIDSLALASAYGSGVHAYFSGNYERSYDDLSHAIEAGSLDPRAYYFRGLSALKLGRVDEAEADFAQGSTQETEGAGAWPVSRSLERVQGPERLQLERHRMRARVAALQRQRDAVRQRYSQIEDAEADVLRRRRPVVERPLDAESPFSGEAAPAPAPRARLTPPAEDVPSAEPAADEPEAEMADEPEAEPMADEPADDPFGEMEEEPAAEADPFGEPKEPAADDPFGDLKDPPPAE